MPRVRKEEPGCHDDRLGAIRAAAVANHLQVVTVGVHVGNRVHQDLHAGVHGLFLG